MSKEPTCPSRKECALKEDSDDDFEGYEGRMEEGESRRTTISARGRMSVIRVLMRGCDMEENDHQTRRISRCGRVLDDDFALGIVVLCDDRIGFVSRLCKLFANRRQREALC